MTPRARIHPLPLFLSLITLIALASAAVVPAAAAAERASRWKLVPFSGFGTFTGVSGLTNSDLWVVGYGYDQLTGRDLPVAQHWDGSRFTKVNVPAGSPGYNHLEGVVMVGADDVWAVGYSTPRYYSYVFKPLIEHWDGTAWKTMASPYQGLGELTAVVAISSTDVWAAGLRWTNPQGTLLLHWDGTRWTTVSDGHASDNTVVRGLAAVSAANILAGGSTVTRDGNRVTFVERWDGASWKAQTTPSPDEYNEFNAMAADPSGASWGIGWKSPDLGYFAFTERYDGTAWTVEPTPDLGTPNNNLYGAVMTSPTQAWAVGYQSGHGVGPVILKWDGSAWTVDPNPASTCCTLYGIGRAGKTLWAVGDNMIMRRGI